MSESHEQHAPERRRFPVWSLVLAIMILALVIDSTIEYYSADLIIQPVSISVGLDREGISSPMLTHQIAEDLLSLISSTRVTQAGPGGVAGSGIRASSIPASASAVTGPESLDIEIPETGLSLKAITGFVQHFLPKRHIPVLSGDAVLLGNEVLLKLSVGTGEERASPPDTWSETFPLASMAAHIREGATAMLAVVDPLSAAMRHYYYDQPTEQGRKAALEILMTQSHSYSKVRARAALVLWAGIYVDNRKYREALSLLQQAERNSGIDENILLGRASVYGAMRDSTRSIELTQRAVLFHRTADTLVAAGDALQSINNTKAARYYRAALDMDAHFWPAYIGLSRVYVRNGDWLSAISNARLATEDTGSYEEQGDGWAQLGNIALQRRQFEEAIRDFARAYSYDGGTVDEFEGIAKAEHAEGVDALADRAFQAAFEVSNDAPSIYKDWGDMVHYTYGDLSRAEQLYKLAISKDEAGNFDSAHSALGSLYFELGRFSEARQEFQTAVGTSAFRTAIELDWGDMLLLTGSFADAETHYARAVQFTPDSCEANLALARLEVRRAVDNHHPERVDELYNRASRACIYPEQAYSDWKYAISVSAQSEVEPGPIDDNLLARDPGSVDAWLETASLPGRGGQMKLALTKVIYPAGLLAQWAQSSFEAKQYEDAEQLAQVALARDRDNTLAHALLVAISVARGSVSHDELHTKLLSSLLDGDVAPAISDVLANRDWWQDAIKVYENCVRIDNGNADAQLKLASALYKLGKPDVAKQHLIWAAQGYMFWGSISDAAEQTFNLLLQPSVSNTLPAGYRAIYQSELTRVRAALARERKK